MSPDIEACRLALFALVRLRDTDALRSVALNAQGQPISHHQPVAVAVEITTEEQDRADAMIARLEPVAAPVQRMAGGRPVFGSDLEWARWVLQNPTAATPQDFSGLREKLRRRTFRDLLDMEGVDTAALQGLTEQARGALCA
jgi:putative transposase